MVNWKSWCFWDLIYNLLTTEKFWICQKWRIEKNRSGYRTHFEYFSQNEHKKTTKKSFEKINLSKDLLYFSIPELKTNTFISASESWWYLKVPLQKFKNEVKGHTFLKLRNNDISNKDLKKKILFFTMD